MKIEISNIGQLPEVARNLLSSFPQERFFAFFGKMGVGKTTLIKELCAAFGVEDNVCSPTFAIVNEYSRPLNTGSEDVTVSPSGRKKSKNCSPNTTSEWISKNRKDTAS